MLLIEIVLLHMSIIRTNWIDGSGCLRLPFKTKTFHQNELVISLTYPIDTNIWPFPITKSEKLKYESYVTIISLYRHFSSKENTPNKIGKNNITNREETKSTNIHVFILSFSLSVLCYRISRTIRHLTLIHES